MDVNAGLEAREEVEEEVDGERAWRRSGIAVAGAEGSGGIAPSDGLLWLKVVGGRGSIGEASDRGGRRGCGKGKACAKVLLDMRKRSFSKMSGWEVG